MYLYHNVTCIVIVYPANPTVDMPQEGERPLPAKDVEEMKKRQGMEELAEAQLGHAVTSKR